MCLLTWVTSAAGVSKIEGQAGQLYLPGTNFDGGEEAEEDNWL